MLMIELLDAVAVWNPDRFQFRSKDSLVEQSLNGVLDEEELRQVDIPFRKGGMEGLALKQVQAVYGEAIEVIEQTPPPVPEEQEGVVY